MSSLRLTPIVAVVCLACCQNLPPSNTPGNQAATAEQTASEEEVQQALERIDELNGEIEKLKETLAKADEPCDKVSELVLEMSRGLSEKPLKWEVSDFKAEIEKQTEIRYSAKTLLLSGPLDSKEGLEQVRKEWKCVLETLRGVHKANGSLESFDYGRSDKWRLSTKHLQLPAVQELKAAKPALPRPGITAS